MDFSFEIREEHWEEDFDDEGRGDFLILQMAEWLDSEGIPYYFEPDPCAMKTLTLTCSKAAAVHFGLKWGYQV